MKDWLIDKWDDLSEWFWLKILRRKSLTLKMVLRRILKIPPEEYPLFKMTDGDYPEETWMKKP